MELFGIMLGIPVALVVSTVYTNFVIRTYEKSGFIFKAQRVLPYFIIPLLILEVVVLVSMGAFAAHQKFGGWFDWMHTANLFLGSAAVVNLVVAVFRRFEQNSSYPFTRFTACSVCFVMMIVSMFTNIYVYEDTYGVDGMGRTAE